MNPELEKLIDLALADGILTDKERAVLQKKAESLGVDQDEFEMILEGKLQLAQKAAATPPSKVDKPKSNKKGDFIKCPSCGAPVKAFETICPECGHEFSGVAANNTISVLNEKLNNLDSSQVGIDDLRAKVISTFPIPTTKEDMLEFIALAIPKTGKNTDYDERNAWKQKCEEIIIKLELQKKLSDFDLSKIESFKKTLSKNKKGVVTENIIIWIILIILFGGVFGSKILGFW